MASQNIQTLNELFLRAMETRTVAAPFLARSGGRYRPVPPSETLRDTATLARVLEGHGIRRGDRVALLSENRIEWALSDYAILGLGAVTVPLYPTLLEADVQYILRDCGAHCAIVSTQEHLRKVLSVKSMLPDLKLIIAMESGADSGDVLNWRSAIAAQREKGTDDVPPFKAAALESRPEDVATILYTSGTTGTPKGVVLTHANIVFSVRSTESLFGVEPGDVAMSFLPLSHIFERTADYFYLNAGATIAHAESAEALPRNLLEVRPTIMMVVPRVLEKVHAKVLERVNGGPALARKIFNWALEQGTRSLKLSVLIGADARPARAIPLSLRWKRALADRLVFRKIRSQMGGRLRTLVSGAAPASSELLEFFFAIGLPVYEGYGLSETSPTISVNYPGAVKIGTVGRVLEGVEVRLGEAEDGPQEGSGREILVRGPNVMPGYYHLDDENRRAFTNGWFHTGDLGAMDSDGFLTITGRKKNLFKTSGGKYVSPEKLENLFQGDSIVSQILVLGEGRKFAGALVVPHFARLEEFADAKGISFASREELTRNAAVTSFVQSRVDAACQSLPPHERIRQIVLLANEFSIERGELSATLKVKRGVVEREYGEQIEEMFQRRAPETEPTRATTRK